MKKWDIIIIAIVAILSFTPYGAFYLVNGRDYDKTVAEIKVDGEIYKTIDLSDNKGKKTFAIKNHHGENVITVEDNKIKMEDADCPDKVCIKPGFINKPGQTLVCLPHKVVIEIKGLSADGDSEIIAH